MGDHIPATPPMTPERLAEIRDSLGLPQWPVPAGAAVDLLAEVDRLTAEVDSRTRSHEVDAATFRRLLDEHQDEVHRLTAERDRWLTQVRDSEARVHRAETERDALRERVLALADQHEYQRGEGFLLEASDRLMSAALREVPALIRAAVQDQPAELKGSAGNLSLTGENASPLEDDPPPPQRPRRPWDVAFANLPALDELRARMNAAAAELLAAFNLGAQPLRIRDEPDGATTYARLDREHGPPPPAPFVHSNGYACFGCQSCLDDGGPELAEAADRG